MEQLIGLVLCGGQSARMGRDKSLLNYHGIAQRYFLYGLLQPFCKKVFLSCNARQVVDIDTRYAFIADDEKYNNIGPMAALLSAFDQYPNDAFLVIGCDYPFIKNEDILQLLNARDHAYPAVSFFNEGANLYEPLLSVYEKNIAGTLLESFQQQQYSLRTVLQKVNARKIYPKNIRAIKTVDTPEDHLMAMEEIKRTAAE